MAQSSIMPPDTEPSSPGTWGKSIDEYFEPANEGGSYRYMTFSVQNGYKNFSLDEHRLADYKKFNPNSRHTKRAAAKFTNTQTLKLLRGKAAEVRVGPTPSQDGTWSLPVELISHHSPHLKAHHLWKQGGPINLPEHDPAVFGLFVEWMYYGSYNSSTLPKHPNINAKCWIFGDYLLCTGFKNYALGCLFKEHAAAVFGIPVSFEDVQYVCNTTSSDSKLKRFYLDFVSDHFGDPCWLHGDMSDWERFLQDQPEIRSVLLRKLRFGPPKEPHVKSISMYLEPENLASESPLRNDTNVAGLAVEKEEDKVSEL
ncbi:sdr family protein [Fusarium langsethiae]|uniref:Sdr family protein n=1 Tax=Fusarium langsethiae TaxID=179993 RepID=A0A0N0V5Z2_FUSLA|nr:sdr family protein [Fusarium langsethiae]GKU06167.1 unnamed protein product [Fusarium langsethiae]GKU16604.1 unnamed protein product [Fusarium langsethiae]